MSDLSKLVSITGDALLSLEDVHFEALEPEVEKLAEKISEDLQHLRTIASYHLKHEKEKVITED